MKCVLRSTLLTSTLVILTPLTAYGQSPQTSAPPAERKVAPIRPISDVKRTVVPVEQRMEGKVVAFDKSTRLVTVALSDGRRLTLPIAGTEDVPLGITFTWTIHCKWPPFHCSFSGSLA